MNLINKLVSLLNNKDLITYSNLTTISTKYGLYKVKAYKHNDNEYLAIMSRGFYETKEPIVYIHSNFHVHSDPDSNIRYSNNEITTILKIIHKTGGLIIYPSNIGNIDEFLEKMNTRKLESEKNAMKKEKVNLGFKIDEPEYHSLCLILKNLNLSTVRLITNDIKLAALTERIGINVVKRVPAISYIYGK